MIRPNVPGQSDSLDLGAAAQILCIDVGNSSVHLGAVYAGKTSDAAVVLVEDIHSVGDVLRHIWERLDARQPRVIVTGSVAPKVLQVVHDAVDDVLGEEMYIIGDDLPLPIPVAVENPQAVGIDRVCAAAAAHATLEQACVVADFGTAITIDLVGDDGVFMGGTILPGLKLSAAALQEGTAALPHIKIVEPSNPWGRDTVEAINNGIFYGAIGALREIVERYATEIGRWPPLVVTGGASDLIAKHAEFVDHVVPDLTLRGIALAYHRGRSPSDA